MLIDQISIVVPMKPPSVNRYYSGRTTGFIRVSAEGRAFKDAIALLLRGDSLCDMLTPRQLKETTYCVEVWIFLGKNQKLDGDNCWKGILDGLKAAGAIHTDTGSVVTDTYMHVRETREVQSTTTYITAYRLPVKHLQDGQVAAPAPAVMPYPVIKDGRLISI
jgi:Holliday junction resolvase RusA-like endonuclease